MGDAHSWQREQHMQTLAGLKDGWRERATEGERQGMSMKAWVGPGFPRKIMKKTHQLFKFFSNYNLHYKIILFDFHKVSFPSPFGEYQSKQQLTQTF